MDDKLLNFVSWIVIGLVMVTIASVWIGNISRHYTASETVYPISQEFDGYTLHFENQTDYLTYFLGREYTLRLRVYSPSEAI